MSKPGILDRPPRQEAGPRCPWMALYWEWNHPGRHAVTLPPAQLGASGRWFGSTLVGAWTFTIRAMASAGSAEYGPGDSVGTFTQLLDRHGTLWLAGTENRQVSIRRFDDVSSTLSEPTISPLAIQDCTLFLGAF